MPKVSVIIPVYGVEKYIERCARSLFEQTLDDLEFIFVNDCTIDRSIEILEGVIEKYKSLISEKKYIVKIENMLTNSGQALVREHGTKLATGDFIIHCDSDDWVETTMYEKMYTHAVASNYDVVACDFYRTDGVSYKNQSRIVSDEIYGNKLSLISKMLVGSDLTSLCTKIVRKEIYDKIVFPKHNMQEDAYLSLQIYFFAQKVGRLHESLYYYYNNPLSISRHPSIESYLDRLNQVCTNTNSMIAFAEKHGIYDQLIEEFDCQKLRARNHIVPITNESQYYTMWRNTYPEIDNRILNNSKIDTKERRQYILIRLKVYHVLNNMLILLNLKK